ncbi:uncharacterized protein LOC108898237 isoform X1 [Lates calcarifer]|uniref:Uncharacterized protein LOC108898237 isoform X1 n=1 Tax=Lates calcarifer TaxID=8187 RepID=A0AAJ7VH66_LATCA|nr:uncharacterized protein LOC108898237 isoform X1 [Lates calcarifer]XP_018553671.1 uncharacterized protein LOC108898237 isoform X1 [Lates calcarifer]XP_018553673.1 uncharacterized protein LOC108898237 isoform X1 [Lates calcarifer]XP_050922699.1 uncharacterized protein LOC108898237 isoform X1 [Lates calcarifer]
MLSSTVVTVLAPHWSGRLRRTKRFEGSGTSDVQGNLQDVTNTAANSAHFQETQNQQGVERVLTDGLQATLRVPFLGTRRNTVGWSTVSGPARLDCESKRKMNQTVSLDVNSGSMDNRKLDASALSPVSTTASPLSPLSLDPNEQRSPQTGHQGTLSALSSKPTTSSLLLSLRRNNSGRSSNAASTFSEENPLASDQEGNLFATHLPQTFLNNNERKRSKSLFSPSSMSYRTIEPRPVLSPSNHRERNISESRFFPTSLNEDTEDTPFTQQPQTRSRTQSNFTSSKQALVSRGVSERQQNCCSSDKNTNLIPESSVSSPRHSPYDRTILRKTQSFPRGTTLTSTCWWKQVPLDGSSTNDRTNIKDQPNTSLVPPCHDNSDLTSPGPTDNRRFSSQIPNNNNTTELVCKGNMNLVMKTQGGTHNLTKQRNPEDSPDHKSDRFVKQDHSSNLNNREPQNILLRSKISRTTAQTALSHPKELSKHDVSNSSFTTNVTELPPTLLNPKSSNTPTESSSTYNNNHCSSKTNSTPASPHNKDSEKFTKWSPSLATTITLNSQALTSKITSGVPLTPNTKTSSSFLSHPVSSQTSTHTSSQSFSQTARFTNTATPIGFERNYASFAKPFHPKTLSSLIPTVSAPSKSNYSPVPTASTTSSTIGSHPAATTVPSPSLLAPATPASTSPPTTLTLSSLLTPPATPVITSPKETSSPKEIRTFSNRSERDPKKPWAEGKRVRRVTWEDSVDLQHSEPITVKRPDPSGVPVSPLSPARSPRSVRAPSIFSFLRSSSSTTNTSPLCSPTPKISSIQVGKGGKYRSLSSDSADLTSREQEKSKERPSDAMIFHQERWDLTTPRQERTLSVESGTVQCRSTAPLSLPPDFSSGYKLRYSSPPYSTLMSSRTSQGETNTISHRSPLFPQASQSIYSSHLSLKNEPGASKPPLSLISSPQTVS